MSTNAGHIPSLIPFSTINSISISVKRSNFTSVFFIAACYANSIAERNFAGSGSYILRHIFLNSQVHQLTIMYHLEHTNHDILRNFLIHI